MLSQQRGGYEAFVLALCISVPGAASAAEQLPYGANAFPGIIKAYDFDQGGEGVAYHDSDAVNTSQYYRPGEAVDIGVRGSGSYEVRGQPGEWLEYTVDVPTGGRYEVSITYSQPSGTAQATIGLDGATSLPVTLPATGGHGTFQSYKVPTSLEVTPGRHVLRFTFAGGDVYLRQLSSARLPGRAFYLSRTGAGVKDGSSWSQAFSAAQLPTALNQTLAAGDTLFVAGGLYESSTPYAFNLTTSGTEALTKKVVGVDLGAGPPVFKGKWTPTAPGSSNDSYAFIRFTNAHHWDIQGLSAEGYYHGVRADNSSHLQLSRLHFTRVREGFALSNVSQAKLLQSDVSRYTKRGIRLSETVSDLRVEDFTADATTGDASWPTEAYPFGVSVENPADAATPGSHDLVFNRVTMKNNTFTSTSGYQNGDGFSLERSASKVFFLNSAAFDNTDGGWDDKSQAAYYENCVALRNKRNFRLWNDNAQPTILHNVLSAYAQKRDTYSTAGLWSQGYVEVYNSTFFANEGSEIILENNTTPAARVKVVHSVLSDAGSCGAVASKEGGTTLELVDSVVCEGTAGTPVPLRAPSTNWTGQPADAFTPVNATVTQGYRPTP
ncbi:carbohydrate-binding protein [Archangium violaceum]|uniref:carbohydrate-binding protein n=1 Tax=Archangium violaceum TaxID=83451 RepID=UPI002B31865C|nr:carbohydrate-binding protein [Archangium violaceum]